MGWEGWGVIVAAVGLLLTIMGVVYNAGQHKAKFEALKEWFERENERNSDQHRQFYAFGTQVTTLVADHGNMEKRLDSIEAKLDTAIEGIHALAMNPPPRGRSRSA